jgi:lipopolysaccharide transport system permease protein
MDRPLKETVYSPDSELLSFGKLLHSMWSDLLASRELAWRLLVRNISAQYRQSLLGYAWAFLPPLFTTAIWVFLQSQKVFNVADTGMPYPVFVLTGTVLWQTFVEALNAPLKMVTDSKSMLTKINFPREALILTGIGQVLFNFVIRVLILIPVFWWFDVPAQGGLLLALFGVLSLILFGTTVGLLLTPLGMLYQDVGRALTFGTQALFFLTPIIYPVPQASWAGVLVRLNPVTPLLETTRNWLVTGTTSQLPGFLWVSTASLVLLFTGWVMYRVAMPHLISRMSA